MEYRGFTFVSAKYPGKQRLPERSTVRSAGYDFFCPIDVTISPYTSLIVPTGVKAWMDEDECLMLFNRSSNPKRKGLVLINGVGVIDSDYFNNPDNEGEIGFAFYNITDKPVTIKAGEKLGQGVFTTYLTADNEVCPTNERTGGFGSTGK